ncbi:CHASE2 domain-containing protein [Chloroflexota bacterium]
MITNTAVKGKKNRQQPRLLYHTLILLAVGCLFILFIILVQPFYSINLWLSDQLFVSEPPSTNIVIVGIDDETLETHGRWTNMPRAIHAQAINNLSKAKAKVIGFDILFADSTPDDEMLAAAMRNAGNIVIPIVGTQPQPSTDLIITYDNILPPTSPLELASTIVGHGNILPDSDGTVRHLPLVIRGGNGKLYPAFSLAILHTFFSIPPPQEYWRHEGALYLLNRVIPVDTSYDYRINFAPEDSSRPYISYGDVISGNFDPMAVENKIILVGMVATGELDKWVVPTSSAKIPGVYIQATTVDNILNNKFLTETGMGTTLMILFLLLGITGFTLPRFGLRWGGVVMGVLMAGYLVVSFLTFEKGYILNIMYPLLMPPVIYVSSSLTQNVAMAIENTRLNLKVVDGYKGTIRALAASIDAKDHYTRGHSQRVTEFALLGAMALNISQEELEVLEYAGILHDIGKIGIPDNILSKPGRLTPEEFDIIRRHPRIGADIMKDISFLEEARKIALHHHERYDGTGYPDGIIGNDIPLGARLLAVADAFDSMTSNRSYRSAMSTEEALNELRKCCGTQFCPIAVEAFISSFASHVIKSSTGRYNDSTHQDHL